MTANGYVYETFVISESKPVKPLQIKLSVTNLKLALSAKCFIYFVGSWALFYSLNFITKSSLSFKFINVESMSVILVPESII